MKISYHSSCKKHKNMTWREMIHHGDGIYQWEGRTSYVRIWIISGRLYKVYKDNAAYHIGDAKDEFYSVDDYVDEHLENTQYADAFHYEKALPRIFPSKVREAMRERE